jgi:DNA-binding transcriptional regulator GbsR (MarR family)
MSSMEHAGTEPAERAAAKMTAAGMPRMPARVMMALVGSPDAGYTAAELAERLGVSAAAVSGAVRYLQAIHIIHRLPHHGDRRDRYDIRDGGWDVVITANMPLYERLADAVDLIADENSAAPQSAIRARDMSEFFRFLARRMPQLLDEWHAERSADAPGTGATS